MVGCGLACPEGGGAGVSGCEFRGSGWGWELDQTLPIFFFFLNKKS